MRKGSYFYGLVSMIYNKFNGQQHKQNNEVKTYLRDNFVLVGMDYGTSRVNNLEL